MYNLYEFFGLLRLGDLSDDLYNNGVYTSTGISMFAVVVLGMIIFYLLKTQKPLTFRLPAWFITVFVLGVINFCIAYALSNSTLYGVYAEQNQDLPYGFGNFAGFALINFVWSFVFCLISSVAIQLFFTNKHGNVPFRFPKSHK